MGKHTTNNGLPWRRSETKRRRELHDAVALLGCDGPEERCVQQSGRAVEAEVEVASVVRPQRMIQEVVGVKPELQLLPFPFQPEVLEKAQVGDEIGRSVNHRQSRGTVLADLGWESEAAR